MYCVIFHRADGKPTETYWYRSESDAIYHASLFDGDDSGLYSHIDVVDGGNIVIHTITF